jgi:hypothetical protein
MLYKDNFLLLFLVSLLSFVLSVFSAGILAGPAIAGVFLIILNLIKEPSSRPVVGDIFKGFSFFEPTFIFVVVWMIIMVAGYFLLSILPNFLEYIIKFLFFIVLVMVSQFGILLIIDKKVSFQEAWLMGFKVMRIHFPLLFAFTLIWMILSAAGGILYLIGIVLTMPISFCMITYAYLDLFNGKN